MRLENVLVKATKETKPIRWKITVYDVDRTPIDSLDSFVEYLNKHSPWNLEELKQAFKKQEVEWLLDGIAIKVEMKEDK